MTLRGQCAIVGIGEFKPRRDPGDLTVERIMLTVAGEAIKDAGLTPGDIDGVLVGPPLGVQGLMWSSAFRAGLRANPRYSDSCDMGGASAAAMVYRAAVAIQAGICHTVLCVTSEVLNTELFMQAVTPKRPRNLDALYGWSGSNTGFALLAQRHFYEYGTTSEQLAKIAVDQRTNACHNPMALFGDQPLTIADVMNSRMICDPLHLLECVRPCTGGAALIVTSADRARDLRKPPVYLLGAAEASANPSMHARPNLTTTPVSVSAPEAMHMAEVQPRDIKLASVYDCYTITVLVTLEDAGFCPKGEGGPFVMENDLTFKGSFPVNTHGGQLSFGQPALAGGMSQVTEAVRQVRGKMNGRQVKDCDLAYVHGVGGSGISDSVSLILGRSR